jgi:hypothetical protein
MGVDWGLVRGYPLAAARSIWKRNSESFVSHANEQTRNSAQRPKPCVGWQEGVRAAR